MKEELIKIQEQAVKVLDSIKSLADLENFRIQYLGKKGHITSALKKRTKRNEERGQVLRFDVIDDNENS